MADIHGSPADAGQNPQAPDSGSAPVPFTGSLPSEPPMYDAAMTLAMNDFSAGAMGSLPSMPGLSESPGARDIAAGLADAPYYAGDLSPIDAMGDPDAGGRDDVAATVQGSVDAATARFHEHESDLGAGGTIGDLMTFPPGPLDPGAGVGNVMPTGGFYDPPRSYE